MKRLLLLAVAILSASVARAQVYTNPVGANLTVQDSGTCSTSGSFLWQHLPVNAGTTTVNLAGTFSATVTVRESNNGGATWTTAGTQSSVATVSYSTNGFTDLCADITTFTSGNVGVSISTGLQQVQSVVAGSITPLQTAQLTAGNLNAVYASPYCSVTQLANCYFVYDDAQWVYDATTNTAATNCNGVTVPAGTCITLTATDPAFSCGSASFPCTSGGDIGKVAFATGDPFSGGVLFTQGTTVNFIEIIDAQHAEVSAAVNTTLAGTTVFVWCHDDTTNLAAADNARYYNRSFVGTLHLPQGGMCISSQMFNLPTGKGIEFGASTIGEGELNTLVIILPTLNLSGCNGLGTNVCYGGAPGGTNGKTFARDWSLWGGGNNRTGQADGAKVISNFTFMEDWECIGFAASDVSTSLIGISMSVQGSYMTNASASDGCGANNLNVSANGAKMSGSFAGEGAGTSVVVTGATTTLSAQANIFGPCCTNSTPGTDVQVTNGATMNSTNDVAVNPQPGSSDCYTVGGGSGTSNLNLVGITCTASSAGDVPLFTLSGGVLSAFKFIVTPPSGGACLTNNGTYYDDGGENTCLANGTIGGTGKAYNDLSVTGANCVIGNFALGAGWGTTAAVTAVTGPTKLCQFTITNSGTGQAAGTATFVYTFPTTNASPFPQAPICKITGGGTQPSPTSFTSTTTSLAATFTYTGGTPVAGDTEVLQAECHVL